MMTKIELKMMHSNDLRELKKMIQEELNFRDDIGKEIETHEPHNHKIEDSLFSEEDEIRMKIYEEKY